MYHIEEFSLPALNAAAHDFLAELQTGQRDGVVVRQALSPAQVAFALADMERWRSQSESPAHRGPTPFGETVGPMMSSQPPATYWGQAEACEPLYAGIMEGGYVPGISSLLAPLCGGRPLVRGANAAGRAFAPGNYRIVQPGRPGFEPHVHRELTPFSPMLQQVDEVSEHFHELSFFFVLQDTPHGGDLELLHLNWDSTPSDLIAPEVVGTTFKDRPTNVARLAYFAQMPRTRLRLLAGDMVCFASSRIWHQITPVTGGDRSRITLGSFITRHRTEDTYLFWI